MTTAWAIVISVAIVTLGVVLLFSSGSWAVRRKLGIKAYESTLVRPGDVVILRKTQGTLTPEEVIRLQQMFASVGEKSNIQFVIDAGGLYIEVLRREVEV